MMLALAATPVVVTVNGTPVPSDVPPLVQRGRVLLPARAVFGALGADVSYDAKTGHVMVRRGSLWLQITIGAEAAFVGQQAVRLDVPAQIYDGRTMVPLRFVAQSLGATVTYSSSARTVAILEPNIANSLLGNGNGNGNVASAGGPGAPSYAQPNAAQSVPPPYVPQPAVQPAVQPADAPPQYALSPLGASMLDDAVGIALGGPAGGSGYVNLCGYGSVPLIYDPQRGTYYAQLPLPSNAYQAACYVTGYFYDPAGRAHYLSLPAPFTVDTRTVRNERPRPTPSPSPSPTPSPRPTNDPAHTRNLQSASPSPSPPPRSLVRVL
jgi:hypothetical protein